MCPAAGEYARSMLYCPETDELVYPAGSVVVAMAGGAVGQQLQQPPAPRQPQGSQRFFLGHSSFVCCLALGGEGQLLATGQEGKAAMVRVWDFRPARQQQHDAAGNDGAAVTTCSGVCLAVLCGELIAATKPCTWAYRQPFSASVQLSSQRGACYSAVPYQTCTASMTQPIQR